MAFLDIFSSSESSAGRKLDLKNMPDPDGDIEHVRKTVRASETTNTHDAMNRAWDEVSKFRKEHPEKMDALTNTLTRDALLPQLEITFLEKEGFKRYGTLNGGMVNDQISKGQLSAAEPEDKFERALVTGLLKDFDHYTGTDGKIIRHHVEDDLLNGMVHNPDFYRPLHDPT